MPVADGKRIPFRKQRRILGETPETGQLVMMLQEEIVLNISECIVLAVRIMQYRKNLTYVTLLMDLQ
jgi:hypothetical protein